jgi:hypothetical protein
MKEAECFSGSKPSILRINFKEQEFRYKRQQKV